MDVRSDLKNAQLEVLASDPSAGKKGRVFYSDVGGMPKIDNGTSIVAFGLPVILEVTSSSQSMVSNVVYVANCTTSIVTFTLPTTATVGDRFRIVGKGIGGWRIAQNASQYIIKNTGTTLTGITGYLLCVHYRSCVELVCTIANTEFTVVNSEGKSLPAQGRQGTVKGYVAGGAIVGGGGTQYDIIDDIVFVADTSATLTAVLSQVKQKCTSVSSDTKGYFMGGGQAESGTSYNTIEAITFSGETTAVIGTGVLDTAKRGGAGVNSDTKGYILGGFTTGAGAVTDVIEDITFSTETSVVVSTGTINPARTAGVGANSVTKGYIFGGAGTTAGGNLPKNDIDDLTFATETSSTLSAIITGVAGVCGAGVSSIEKGYLLGRYNNGSTYYMLSQAFTFASETIESLTDAISAEKSNAGGVTGSTEGYMMGGENSTIVLDAIEKINFSSEVSDAIAATLGTARANGAGVQN